LKKRYFIALEGPDGSGKSTQAHLLSEKLIAHGYSCIVTEQPGGTEEGRRIRNILLNPEFDICVKTELFLFLADRAEHVAKIIEPALQGNAIVISSRYLYSTLVYQGLVREVAPYDFLLKMNLFAVNNIVPDIVFYIDIAPEDGLAKAKNSSLQKMKYPDGDRIEKEGLAFQEKVRAGYHELASRFGDLFVTIDGKGKSRDEIGDTIYSHIKGRLSYD
jgi:dTMP kinase